MSLTEILEGIGKECKDYKTELCVEGGGPADGAPFILGADYKGTPFLIPDTLDGHPTDNLPIILNAILKGLEEKNGTMRWDWLAYVVEGYANGGENDLPEDWERGSLERDFKNNPSSQVKEGIIITAYTWEGESACRTMLYHYGDDGLPVWEEPVDADEAPDGLVPFIFNTFRTFCANEGDLAKLIEGFPSP
jgi:hypothetical protein